MHTNTPINLDAKPVLAWTAPSRPTYERTKRWYTVAFAIVFVVAAYGIFSDSWMLAIVSVLAGGMYVLVHDHRPPLSSIELYDNGLRLNGTFVRWDELEGFWFIRTPEFSEVRFVPKVRRGRIAIQTGTQDITQLRMVLAQRLPELTHKKESLLDVLLRICKL